MEDLPSGNDEKGGKDADGQNEMTDAEFDALADRARQEALAQVNDQMASNLGMLEERKVAEKDLDDIKEGLDPGSLCRCWISEGVSTF